VDDERGAKATHTTHMLDAWPDVSTLFGMSDRDEFRSTIEKRQHAAEEALIGGNVGPRLEMWSRSDPVTLFAALGPSKAGWTELEPMFRSVANRVSGGRDVTYELVTSDVGGDIAWSVGIARFTVGIDGGPIERRVLRLTHLYRREDGDWKVVHEHSDFQPADHATPAAVDRRT
jgi:ketosteroid isomerase-like protein